jgi:putative transcriptional regulator
MTEAYRVVRRKKSGRGQLQVDWAARIVAMRGRAGLTQKDFAALIGVSAKTLENWEQSRRQPTGPAAVLLAVVERDVGAVMRVVGRG